MKTALIIGAGQLGSRHLQGLAKYVGELNIFVLDQSADALKIASDREKEIIHNHKLVYTQSWDILPSFFDLVIVATNANVRELVIEQLVKNHKVQYLILEKILFQELNAYERVDDLLNKHNIVTYVNHPRRMFESYASLKAKIVGTGQSVYSVVGGNWGLGCSALHFLDLFVYLSGNKVQELNANSIDDQFLESTRKGFIEFTGTLTGCLEDGSFFSITSLNSEPSSITVTILNAEQRFVIQEGGKPQIYEFEKNDSFNLKANPFKIQYQSELSTNIAAQLLNNKKCFLPTYKDARHTHELFLTTMLEKYNKITGLQKTILPVT